MSLSGRRPIYSRGARVALLALVVALGSAPAAEARSAYCSPTGDWCTEVLKRDGRVYLRLATFSFRGTVRVCVTPPRGDRTCRRSRLRRNRENVHVSSVRWDRRFPTRGRGTYRVRWYYDGNRLGPALSFRR